MKNKVIPNPILPAAGVRRNIAADGVREEARLVELAHCAEERGVEILGIQEHRRVPTDNRIVYCRVERCMFITASAWRNEAQAATGGVGLMLGPLARKALRRGLDEVMPLKTCGATHAQSPNDNIEEMVTNSDCTESYTKMTGPVISALSRAEKPYREVMFTEPTAVS
ncbi:hypothetical protein KUCAC02_030965 [Chaenocephalus aceratus]|uniref:Uncharacterized protein n=1 Tax=Chaenocephalus aceratus TaxID=36190 RepID=A0ACB9XLP8_CHAAC|nr:hypothetical protein KUCAC02_030965 [Chaenocephalus aceratus]